MEDLSNFSIKGIPFPMAFVPPGIFQIEGGKEICFEKGFYIGKYPVTQILWQAVMGKNPASFKGENFPVESISWDDICQENGFLDQLNILDETKKINFQDGLKFQLPSETMWEYAARGGSQSKGFPYAGSHTLKEVGWYNKNSYNEIKPIGLKLPNELGLYDMSGNVWEWCADNYQKKYENVPDNGRPFLENGEALRVVRGGFWGSYVGDCRFSYRFRLNADGRYYVTGFRLARY